MPNQPDTEKPMPAKIEALLAAIGGAENCRDTNDGRVCGPCWEPVIRACEAIDPTTISVTC